MNAQYESIAKDKNIMIAKITRTALTGREWDVPVPKASRAV